MRRTVVVSFWAFWVGAASVSAQVSPGTAELALTVAGGTAEQVSLDSEGSFLAAWRSANLSRFFVDRFDAEGRPLGPRRSVEAPDPSAQLLADASGRLVMVYVRKEPSGERTLLAQGFDEAGFPRGGPRVVAEPGEGRIGELDTAIDAAGDVAVVWKRTGTNRLRARFLDPAGNPRGPQFRLDDSMGLAEVYPRVASHPNGRFVVLWRQFQVFGTLDRVVARCYDSQGQTMGDPVVISHPKLLAGSETALAVFADGGFVAAWATDEGDVRLRRFDAAGAALGDERVGPAGRSSRQVLPALAADAEGGFLLTWVEDGPSYLWTGVSKGRRFDATGAPLGGDFELSLAESSGPVPAAINTSGDALLLLASNRLYRRVLPGGAPAGILQLVDLPGQPFSQVAEDDVTVEVGVARTGGTCGQVRVEYFTGAGSGKTATAGEDYMAAAGELIFEDGESRKSFPLTILEDDEREGRESFTVGLRDPTPGATLRAPATVEVSLYDDETTRPDEVPAPPQGAEIEVSAEASGRSPRVAMAEDGSFLVVWQYGDGQDESIAGRLFGADGEPRGSELAVASMPASYSFHSAVDALPDGRFLVVWGTRSSFSAGGDTVLGARWVDSAGQMSSEVVLGRDEEVLSLDVAADRNGRFVVSWGSYLYRVENNVSLRRFDAAGGPLGPASEFQTRGSTSLGVASTESGESVLVWNHGTQLMAQPYDASGRPVGGAVFTIDDSTLPSKESRSAPRPAHQGAGGLVVVWEGETLDGDPTDGIQAVTGRDAFIRFFAAGPAPRTEVLHLDSFQPGDQTVPRLAVSARGDVVAVWESTGELDSGHRAVLARRFSAAGQLLGSRFAVNPGARPQGSPDVASDAAGNFVVVYEAEDVPGEPRIFAQRFTAPSSCTRDEVLCLQGDRFELEVSWRDGRGGSGRGHAVELTADTGAFWFFGPQNVELVVKVLDGREINNHYWVFYGSLSNVEYELVVRDKVTGASKTYVNQEGRFASAGDVTALPP